MKRIAIIAAASGGHIFPAIILAEKLTEQKKDIDIVFISKSGCMEDELFQDSNYKIINLEIEKVAMNRNLFRSLNKLISSFFQSLHICRKNKFDGVIGFGGLISIPVLFAAKLSGSPVMIHEQNVKLGKANKLLSYFVNKVAVSFENSYLQLCKGLISKKVVLTGLPVRSDFFNLDREEALKEFAFQKDILTIAVMGGSQGSGSINRLFTESLNNLPKNLLNFLQIIHICGKNDIGQLEEFYRNSNLNVKLYSFFKKISFVYKAADLIISRAGASTIAELATYAKKAVLIPYPYAGRHQFANAKILSDDFNYFLVEENISAVENLSKILNAFIQNKGLINSSKFNPELSHKEAGNKLSEEVLSLC